MTQGTIETSLSVPLGEATVHAALGDSSARPEFRVLAVGELGEALTPIEAALAPRGARLELAAGSSEALPLLAAEPFAFMLLDAALPDAELDELTRWSPRERLAPRLPIVLWAPSDGDTSRLARVQCDHSRGQPTPAELWIGCRAHPEALAEQFALLLELYRSRSRGLGLEQQLAEARHELSVSAEASAAMVAQAERAQAELIRVQSQLVQAGKLAALGELVAGVAHEINNPLSFALSHLSTLRRGVSRSLASLGELDPETSAESERIEERLSGVMLGLDRIKSLVVKLQTFSRFDDGKSHPVDVAEAIGVVLTILSHRVSARIQLTTEFGKPDVIQCEPSLINQCVMNLVVNAIDAIAENEGSVRISARAEGDSYVIRVIDSGHGVPAELNGKIFDAFFTTKPVGKGTGLGLSIANAVVKKHEGTLTLSPSANGGTEAVIRVPLRRVAPRRR